MSSAPAIRSTHAAQVCLVHMPYSDLEYPTIGLGLLKSYLTQHQIPAKVVYPNFDFAEKVGAHFYKMVANSAPDTLIGEWTFAEAAFREKSKETEPYLLWLLDQIPLHWQSRSQGLTGAKPEEEINNLQWLTDIRDAAPTFVDEVARRILALGPRIVGCSSVFQQHCASLALLRRIKELEPTIVTMMGGANCEEVMGETTHRYFPWVDFVMSGEVDTFFGSFCKLIIEEGIEAAAQTAPKGVFGPLERSESGYEPVAPRGFLDSMDEAAIPDFDDYFEELGASRLSEAVFPGLVFESSRGCWWGEKHHCTFCGLNDLGLVFRSKSPARVVEEVMTLKKRYGVGYMVATDTIIDMKHLRTVLPTLTVTPGHPYIFYEVKANLKRTELKLLSHAGVRTIQPGIESLHDDFLRLIDKGNRWYTNVQLLKWSQEAGISVNWNFLAGAPGEREEWYHELAEWLPSICHLEPPGSDAVIRIRYDRYSVYHSSPERYGLDLEAHPSYGHVYPLPQDALNDMAYVLDDKHETSRRLPADSVGYQAVNERIVAWQQAFRGQNGHSPARLTAKESDDQLIIKDTRPISGGRTLTFDGLDRAILTACESAQSLASLNKQLHADGYDSTGQIQASVESLKDLQLLLEWRGRVLSLHVNEPVTRYLTPAERPGMRVVRKDGAMVWG